MNGKAAMLAARLLPAIRQRHLTNTLGQVTCRFDFHEGCIEHLGRCVECGAAV